MSAPLNVGPECGARDTYSPEAAWAYAERLVAESEKRANQVRRRRIGEWLRRRGRKA